MRLALVVAVLVAVTGCGRVAAPQPPFIRIPERIQDLSASQSAMNIALSWTNPAHNIDGSAATDIAFVNITSAGEVVARIPPTGPGKSQSLSVPVGSGVGVARKFEAWIQTARGKASDSATVTVIPVQVPGAVVNLRAIADQYSIHLTWNAPSEGVQLADAYFVRRLDRTDPPSTTTELQFKDSSFDKGARYSYEVLAARRVAGGFIPGPALSPVAVDAVDKTPPGTPTGLQVIVTDAGAAVTWDANSELDLAGYRVFRNGVAVSAEVQTGNLFFDPDYRSGTTYSVSAVDEFGNASDKIPG